MTWHQFNFNRENNMLNFITDNNKVNEAFRIATGDLSGNIYPYKNKISETAKPAIMAGLDYDKPWCRDAAINTWNGASLIFPEISKNTLFLILEQKQNQIIIGGQYWDAIIWTIGAWYHYLYTGDLNFLATAYEVSVETIKILENKELSKNGLFNGPACYGDGVGAYPIEYADCGGDSEILAWPQYNPTVKSSHGYGIPMQTLSSNCLYCHAYMLLEKMATILKLKQQDWLKKGKILKAKINDIFWNEKKGYYNYITGPLGNSDYQEGIGNSFAILFEIADKEKTESIFKNIYVGKYGIPCLWPLFSRYKENFGRHNGTVWPHIQGFWGHAAAIKHKPEIFSHEFMNLTESACRESQFTEIVHPLSGRPYGGLQECKDKGIITWASCRRQSWSATAYIRLALFGLAGMKFQENGICFDPVKINGVNKISITNMLYHNKVININVDFGESIKISINGKKNHIGFYRIAQDNN